MLCNLEIKSTLSKIKFETVKALCKLYTAVILESNYLGVIEAYGSQSVTSCAKSLATVEANIIEDRSCITVSILDINRTFNSEKTHSLSIIASA